MSQKTLAHTLMLKRGRLLLIRTPAGYAGRVGPQPEGLSVVTESASPFEAIQLIVADRAELEAEVPGPRALLAPGEHAVGQLSRGTSSVATEINRDSIRAYARTVGMDAVARVAIDDNWSAIRLKVV
jgi:hypothetical protein